MERPFVVCHMLASLDGKIDGAFFGAPAAFVHKTSCRIRCSHHDE